MRKYFLIITLVGFLLYFPSLFGPFLWDDEDFVYANQYVANFQIDKFFTQSITSGRGKGSNYFRPIQEIAYSTTHAVFGFNPFWYHLLNVLVHIGAACAIFYLFTLLLKQIKNGAGNVFELEGKAEAAPISKKGQTSMESPKYSLKAAESEKMLPSHFFLNPPFLISLIFLIHPIQTEAVSYISGLSDPLYVLFGFLSLIFFLLKDERKNMIPLSVFFFALSILSKETGLVFLPLLILLETIQQFSNSCSPREALAKWGKSLLPFALCSILYLWYHSTYINGFDIKSAWGNSPYANSVLIRLLTFVQNLFLYVQLLIFPKDLFMERDYTIPIQTHLLNPSLIIFIIVISLIIFALWKFSKLKSLAPMWFCFLAFFISFLPYTGIVLINGIFYEHFLYLPLLFFFAFWIILISSFWQAKRVQNLSLCLMGIILLLFSARNIARQFDWNDAIRFYSQTLEHAPQSIRIINGLGMAQADKGDLNSAIRTYSNGIRINSRVPNLYHNLANAYLAKGDIINAEKYYLKALEVDPNFYYSVQSLANLYQQTGQTEKLASLAKKYHQN